MAEPLYATKDINKAIRAQIRKGASTRIEGLEGQHNIAVGLSKDAKVTIVGKAGDFFGALNNGTALLVKGSAGRFLGDTMSKGTIIVDGSAGDGAGVNMQGGHIVIKGSAGVKAGAGMKGGSMIVTGDCGDMLGYHLFGGDILVIGDAGYDVGRHMLGGTIYVNGNISSLGKGTRLLKLDSEDKYKLKDYLFRQNLTGRTFQFRKIVSEAEVPVEVIRNLIGLATSKKRREGEENSAG